MKKIFLAIAATLLFSAFSQAKLCSDLLFVDPFAKQKMHPDMALIIPHIVKN